MLATEHGRDTVMVTNPPTRRRTIRPVRRLSIVAVAVLALVVPLAGADAQEPDPNPSQVATDRIAGQTRFGTAAEISQATWDAGEPSVVFIANGYRFPDALAANAVAGTYLGPILLVDESTVPQETADELDRLAASGAFIMGGPDAVGPEVQQQLEQRYGADNVSRIAGETRFETAAEVAREIARANTIGTIDGKRAAFLADGGSFPDALAVGPAAFERRIPVLLTAPNELPETTRQALEDLQIEHVVIAGGPAAVSQEVEDQVDDPDTTVERVAGRNRVDTAVQVAEFEVTRLGFDRNELVLARGNGFADALAAGPLAARTWQAPIVLTQDTESLTYDLLQFLVNAGGITDLITTVGGPLAVSERLQERTAQAAKQPLRTISYFTGTKGDVDGFAYFSEHVDWTLTDQRGWALNNDYRYSQVADADAAELRIWLASPSEVEAAAPGCSAAYSCTVGDDVYINEDNWDNGTPEWNDEKGLDEYRHYVVIHEVGHWVGFDHTDCSDYWGSGESDDLQPAPVMEQQSIDAGDCVVNTWPLTQDAPANPYGAEQPESEYSRAYDLYSQGRSQQGTSSLSATDTPRVWAP